MPPQLLSRALMLCRRVSMQNPLFLAAALALSGALACGLAQAQSSPPADAATEQAAEPWRTDRFYLETSLYTVHFHSDEKHDNHQKLILGEWNITEQWLLGASFFDNSFGQPSQHVSGG